MSPAVALTEALAGTSIPAMREAGYALVAYVERIEERLAIARHDGEMAQHDAERVGADEARAMSAEQIDLL